MPWWMQCEQAVARKPEGTGAGWVSAQRGAPLRARPDFLYHSWRRQWWMGKHMLSLGSEARSCIALHEVGAVEVTEAIVDLQNTQLGVCLPCSHLTYPMPLGFLTQLPYPTANFPSPLPYFALPFSQLLCVPALSLCTDYAYSSYIFW